MKRGMTPTACPPASMQPSAAAAMSPVRPAPFTRLWPRMAIVRPSSRARSVKASEEQPLDAAYTQMFILYSIGNWELAIDNRGLPVACCQFSIVHI